MCQVKLTLGGREYETEEAPQLRRLNNAISRSTDRGEIAGLLARVENEGGGRPWAPDLAGALRLQLMALGGAPPQVPQLPVAPPGQDRAHGDFWAVGEVVLRLAAALTAGEAGLPAGQQAWLTDYALLDGQRARWLQATEQARMLIATSRDATEFRDRVRDAMKGPDAIKARIDKAEAQQRREQETAARRAAMLAQRRQERTELAGLVDRYFQLDPNVKVEPPAPALTDEYKLLLEWLSGASVRQLAGSRDRQIAALVVHLGKLRKQRRNGEFGGPHLTLTGRLNSYLAQGRARPNEIKLSLGLPPTDPVELLADPEHDERRAGLVTELATGFIHEAAHVWQIAKYENDSHPWPPDPAAALSGLHVVGDPGIPFDTWPAEVRLAYREFESGGAAGQAAEYQEWKRLKKAITADAYYRLGVKDLRGLELVSHLIELLYTWRLVQPFAEVFPKGSALIDRVLA